MGATFEEIEYQYGAYLTVGDVFLTVVTFYLTVG